MDIAGGGIYSEIRIDKGNLDSDLEKVRQSLSRVAEETEVVRSQMAGSYEWSRGFKELEAQLEKLASVQGSLAARSTELSAARQKELDQLHALRDAVAAVASVKPTADPFSPEAREADWQQLVAHVRQEEQLRREVATGVARLEREEAEQAHARRIQQLDEEARLRRQVAQDIQGGGIITAGSAAAHDEERQVAARHMRAQADRQLAVEEHALEQASARAAAGGERLNQVINAGAGYVRQADMSLAGYIGTLVRTAQASAEMGAATHMATAYPRNLGMSILFASQAVEDLQYGFSAVVNNIPLLVMSMGGSSGLAGGLSILAVGANVALNHWQALMDSFGLGIPTPALDGLEGMEARLKKVSHEADELQKKTRLTFAEWEKLKALKQERGDLKEDIAVEKAAEKLDEIESKPVEARAKGFTDALHQVGGDQAAGHLGAALETQAGANGLVIDPLDGKPRKPEDVRRRLIAAAARGDKFASDTIRKTLVGAFGKDNPFARAIEDQSPEGKRLTKTENEEGKRLADSLLKDAREEKKAGEQAEKDRKKGIDDRAAVLAKGALGTRELANPRSVTEDDVRKALEQSGESPEKARELAGPILEKFQRDLFAEAQKISLQKGITPAEAFQEIVADRREKADREQEALTRDAEEKAKGRLPGVERAAQDLIVQGQLSGLSAEEAQAHANGELAKALKQQGLTEEEANRAAPAIAKDAADKVQERLVQDALNPREAKRSEVIDVRGFNAKVQGGVGSEDDSAKQRLQRLAEIAASSRKLADWVDRNGGFDQGLPGG